MTCIAFAYLQHRRLKAAGRGKKGGRQRATAPALAACDPPRHHRQAVRSACGSLSLPTLPPATSSTPFESAKVVLDGRAHRCIVPSARRGAKGELWYVRVLPPLDLTYPLIFIWPNQGDPAGR